MIEAHLFTRVRPTPTIVESIAVDAATGSSVFSRPLVGVRGIDLESGSCISQASDGPLRSVRRTCLVGKYLVCGSLDGTIAVLDPLSLATLGSVSTQGGAVWDMCAKDGDCVVVTDSGTVELFRIKSIAEGNRLNTLESTSIMRDVRGKARHEQATVDKDSEEGQAKKKKLQMVKPTSVHMTMDDVFVGFSDGVVCRIGRKAFQMEASVCISPLMSSGRRKRKSSETKHVSSLPVIWCMSSVGSVLLVGDSDGRVSALDSKSLAVLCVPGAVQEAHRADVLSMDILSDESLLVTCGKDARVCVFAILKHESGLSLSSVSVMTVGKNPLHCVRWVEAKEPTGKPESNERLESIRKTEPLGKTEPIGKTEHHKNGQSNGAVISSHGDEFWGAKILVSSANGSVLSVDPSQRKSKVIFSGRPSIDSGLAACAISDKKKNDVAVFTHVALPAVRKAGSDASAELVLTEFTIGSSKRSVKSAVSERKRIPLLDVLQRAMPSVQPEDTLTASVVCTIGARVMVKASDTFFVLSDLESETETAGNVEKVGGLNEVDVVSVSGIRAPIAQSQAEAGHASATNLFAVLARTRNAACPELRLGLVGRNREFNRVRWVKQFDGVMQSLASMWLKKQSNLETQARSESNSGTVRLVPLLTSSLAQDSSTTESRLFVSQAFKCVESGKYVSFICSVNPWSKTAEVSESLAPCCLNERVDDISIVTTSSGNTYLAVACSDRVMLLSTSDLSPVAWCDFPASIERSRLLVSAGPADGHHPGSSEHAPKRDCDGQFALLHETTSLFTIRDTTQRKEGAVSPKMNSSKSPKHTSTNPAVRLQRFEAAVMDGVIPLACIVAQQGEAICAMFESADSYYEKVPVSTAKGFHS